MIEPAVEDDVGTGRAGHGNGAGPVRCRAVHTRLQPGITEGANVAQIDPAVGLRPLPSEIGPPVRRAGTRDVHRLGSSGGAGDAPVAIRGGVVRVGERAEPENTQRRSVDVEARRARSTGSGRTREHGGMHLLRRETRLQRPQVADRAGDERRGHGGAALLAVPLAARPLHRIAATLVVLDRRRIVGDGGAADAGAGSEEVATRLREVDLGVITKFRTHHEQRHEPARIAVKDLLTRTDELVRVARGESHVLRSRVPFACDGRTGGRCAEHVVGIAGRLDDDDALLHGSVEDAGAVGKGQRTEVGAEGVLVRREAGALVVEAGSVVDGSRSARPGRDGRHPFVGAFRVEHCRTEAGVDDAHVVRRARAANCTEDGCKVGTEVEDRHGAEPVCRGSGQEKARVQVTCVDAGDWVHTGRPARRAARSIVVPRSDDSRHVGAVLVHLGASSGGEGQIRVGGVEAGVDD